MSILVNFIHLMDHSRPLLESRWSPEFPFRAELLPLGCGGSSPAGELNGSQLKVERNGQKPEIWQRLVELVTTVTT